MYKFFPKNSVFSQNTSEKHILLIFTNENKSYDIYLISMLTILSIIDEIYNQIQSFFPQFTEFIYEFTSDSLFSLKTLHLF